MPWNHQRHRRLLEGSRTFGELGATTLDRLACHARTRELGHGEQVWRAGEAASRFVVVTDGVIKLVQAMPDGSDAIVGLFGPGESIGDVAVCGRLPYPAAAVVVTRTAQVIEIEAEPVLHPPEAWADVWAAASASLAGHACALYAKIAIMSAGSVHKRLATLLLCLAERFGRERDDGRWFVPVPLSRADIGCLIGARVETAIRAMRQMEREGLVVSDVDGLLLPSLAELRARTEGASRRNEEPS